jgi:stage III sporulation protein SpoIIIAA
MSGAEEGIRVARSGDQEPERNVREIWAVMRAVRKEVMMEGVSSRSPEVVVEGEVGGEIRGGEVVVAQVRRRLGSVASRSTEAL